MSEPLFEAFRLLRRDLHYRTDSEMICGFTRYQGISQQPHKLTEDWANMTGYERDQLDAGILELVQTKAATKGSWLKALIYECIMEVNGEGAKSPRVNEVMDMLPKKISEKLK